MRGHHAYSSSVYQPHLPVVIDYSLGQPPLSSSLTIYAFMHILTDNGK